MEQELEAFRGEVRSWLATNVPPPPEFQLPESFMEVGRPEQFEWLQAWQRKVYDAGYLGMSWPTEYGGHGKPSAYQSIVTEEMARISAPFMVNVIGLMWAGPVILQLGTLEQKQKYIPPMLRGDEIWCQGFSEPNHGSDLASAETTAVRDGDEYVLNGAKIWTSLGTEAKHMILLARTEKTSSKYKGLTFFLAPVDIPGVIKTPIRKMSGEYGFNETRFEDARIPADCVLGSVGEGWSVAMATLMFERGASSGQAGGLMSLPLAVEDAVELARHCTRDGRPAIEDPAIRAELVGLLIEQQGMRMNTERQKHRALVADRPHWGAMSYKLESTEFRRRLTRFAVAIQGHRAGLYVGDPSAVEGGEWQRHYMHAFSATIGGGTSQIQKNILGERLLGLAKG